MGWETSCRRRIWGRMGSRGWWGAASTRLQDESQDLLGQAQGHGAPLPAAFRQLGFAPCPQGDVGYRHRPALEPAHEEQEEFALELIGERSRNGWPWGWVCCSHLRRHPRGMSFGATTLETEGARFLGCFCQVSRSARHGNVAALNANMNMEMGCKSDAHPYARFRCPHEIAWLISRVLTSPAWPPAAAGTAQGWVPRGAWAWGQAGIRVQTPKCRSVHAGGWDLTQTLQKSQDRSPNLGLGACLVEVGDRQKGSVRPQEPENCCQACERGY